MEYPRQLSSLNRFWNRAATKETRRDIWHKMLDIYTDRVYTIGLVSRVPQPIVISKRLRNIPEKGIYNWDPGAHFGLYRPDTFWLADESESKQLN